MTPLHPAERDALAAARRRDAALASDPVRRRAHGVVHTPPELARLVVAGADELVQRRFGLPLGVCDARAQLVDPACGPGAFLAAALGLWQARGRPPQTRLTGIDLDRDALRSARELAPHAPAHFALLEADTLREPVLCELAGAPDSVLVVVGNPPWSTVRSPKTEAMQALLEDFRRDGEGARLPERKLGVLSDAYVRFFRVCAEAARCSSAGAVLGLITNGSFLDGPVHRGMRGALLRWFDEAHVLDLGGSALLSSSRELRDENVFGVRPSVAVTWLCRLPRPRTASGEPPRAGSLRYARVRGTRADKLGALAGASLSALDFSEVQPERPLLRFVPGGQASAEYAAWPSLAECMPFHREGVQTNRDRAVIARDREHLLARLRAFARGVELPALAQAYRDSFHYSVETARRAVAAALERDPDGSAGYSVRRIAYRPFDMRWFCPLVPLCHRPRPELLRAIDHAPQVLISVRKDRGFSPYSHFGAADCAVDNCFLSTRSSCRARAFPACTPDGEDNLEPAVREACSRVAGEPVRARDYQDYALAFLAAASYRERFDSELRVDYPRIPLPSSRLEWQMLTRTGRAIAEIFVAPAAGDPAPFAARARGPVSSAALSALWIGHNRPSDPPVPALVERLERLACAIRESDHWVHEFGHV